jgi:hypothetical protein
MEESRQRHREARDDQRERLGRRGACRLRERAHGVPEAPCRVLPGEPDHKPPSRSAFVL